MSVVVELGICLLILGMTYALMSEGLWGAALMFFNALFAGMIAFNFYEPLAGMLARSGLPASVAAFSDSVVLMALFVASLFLLRVITESIAPAMVRFPTPVYHVGRVVFGLAGAVVVTSILILAYEASPVQKKMLGVVDYKAKPPFGRGLDRGWLAFFQYSTGYSFSRTGAYRRDKEFGNARAFDPEGRWLIDHQDARPYGEDVDKVLGSDSAAAPAEGAAPAGEGAGENPGRAARGDAPVIPGGTAGAAVGLAPVQ